MTLGTVLGWIGAVLFGASALGMLVMAPMMLRRSHRTEGDTCSATAVFDGEAVRCARRPGTGEAAGPGFRCGRTRPLASTKTPS